MYTESSRRHYPVVTARYGAFTVISARNDSTTLKGMYRYVSACIGHLTGQKFRYPRVHTRFLAMSVNQEGTTPSFCRYHNASSYKREN